MGMTDVELTIKHPTDPKKSITQDFLVDSGATYTVLPASTVTTLGLKPNFYREFVLADGKKVKRPIGSATVRYGREEISSPVVLV